MLNRSGHFKSVVLSCIVLIAVGTVQYSCAQQLIDPKATMETQALYKNLHELSKKHTLFGHQDDLAYGVNWRYDAGRSDIKDVVGDYPAVHGWDLAGLEKESTKNIDGIPFSKMKTFIEEGYERGAVITLSWHFDNPLIGGSSWDAAPGTVTSILPGGEKHDLYKVWLDRAAAFMLDLKGKKGEPIPMLFRPFHELNGNWFWWGRKWCTPEEYIRIWRFTVNYLVKEKQLHNLIFVYNTNSFSSEAEFMERYPGDDVVDMLSFDKYQYKEDKDKFISSTRKELEILTRLSEKKKKLSAFSETGYEGVPDPKWWTGTLWPIIEGFPISYVLVWRNAGYVESMKKMHYYAPYDRHPSAPDFKLFYKKRTVLFEKGLKQKNIYQLHSK